MVRELSYNPSRRGHDTPQEVLAGLLSDHGTAVAAFNVEALAAECLMRFQKVRGWTITETNVPQGSR